MDKELVIVVSNETAAYELVKALKALDVEGSIELYASTVVYKAENGAFSIMDEHHLRGPRTAVLAATTGALLGLLGGPIALGVGATATAAAGAAAAGAAMGGTVGATAAIGGDLTYSGFASEFVNAVAASLRPGTYAVLASVAEDWTVPIDTAVAPFGAVVFRQATEGVVLAQLKTDWQSMNDEIDHVEAEIDKAVGDEKAKLVAKRDELRMQRKAKREKLEARVRALQESWEAKIAAMEAKVDEAGARAAERHTERARKLSQFAAVQKKAFHDLFA